MIGRLRKPVAWAYIAWIWVQPACYAGFLHVRE